MINTLTQFQLLDVVALKSPLPKHKLLAGQVGTLVESLAPDVYEVEFSDDDGQTYALLPLHTDQLFKLHYHPITEGASTMSTTIHQYGNGDNVAGDKVAGDKVAGNKITNNNQGANIGNFVNQAQDNAQVTATNFTQTSGTSTAELLQIIATLRQLTTQFPANTQEDLTIDLDDVEAELKKPADQRSQPKLKKRLLALLLAASAIAGPVAAVTDFTNNITDLAKKANIELQLPPAP